MIRDFHLADFLTLANGVCGTAAIFLAMDHVRVARADKVYAAGVLVVAALVFDVLDGRVARWRHKASALGRELEIAGLLKNIKAVKNVVWLTADVHYCAAHYYDPRKAQFADLQKLRGIVTKVIAWDETTPRNYDRRWIDFHGVAANKGGPGNGKPPVSPGTIAPEKWDELAKQVREEYRKDLEVSIAMMSNARK